MGYGLTVRAQGSEYGLVQGGDLFRLCSEFIECMWEKSEASSTPGGSCTRLELRGPVNKETLRPQVSPKGCMELSRVLKRAN